MLGLIKFLLVAGAVMAIEKATVLHAITGPIIFGAIIAAVIVALVKVGRNASR